MKKKDTIKIVNITRNKDDSALKKIITEKISKIISSEHNKA